MEPTERFSNRVQHYSRHRPGYPAGVVTAIANAVPMSPAPSTTIFAITSSMIEMLLIINQLGSNCHIVTSRTAGILHLKELESQ